MELNIIERNRQKIAEILSEEIVINETQDALDLMANAGYEGAGGILLYEKNLKPEFFELRTGMAGEILQKFSNYRIKIAIIGDFEKFNSKSLNAFIVESNRGSLVFFAPDRDTAIEQLTKGDGR